MPLIVQLASVFLSALVATGIWRLLALRFRWLDHPNSRSSHNVSTPRGGGVGVGIGLACFLWWDQSLLQAGGWSLLMPGVLLLGIGLLDDLFTVRARARFLVQLLATAAMWPVLNQLPPLLVTESLGVEGTALSLLVALGILWWVNLFNFMDGIDSLAATEAIFLCFGVTLATAVSKPGPVDMSALGVGVAVCGFLYYNLPRARVFMGDAGSYCIAFAVAAGGIMQVLESGLELWALLILPATFVADSSTTLLGRMLEKAVWYHPHRSHAYQLLAMRCQSHAVIVAGNAVINVVWVLPLALVAAVRPDLGFVLFFVAHLPLVVLVAVVRRIFATGPASAEVAYQVE